MSARTVAQYSTGVIEHRVIERFSDTDAERSGFSAGLYVKGDDEAVLEVMGHADTSWQEVSWNCAPCIGPSDVLAIQDSIYSQEHPEVVHTRVYVTSDGQTDIMRLAVPFSEKALQSQLGGSAVIEVIEFASDRCLSMTWARPAPKEKSGLLRVGWCCGAARAELITRLILSTADSPAITARRIARCLHLAQSAATVRDQDTAIPNVVSLDDYRSTLRPAT